MALPTATRTLQALLPEWQRLLQGWAAEGRLTAAAHEALMLQDDPRPLRRLVKRWAAGDFGDLPRWCCFRPQTCRGRWGPMRSAQRKQMQIEHLLHRDNQPHKQ